MPVVVHMKEYFYQKMPWLPEKCPFKIGKYYGNFSVELIPHSESGKFISSIPLPNGVYREIYKLYFGDRDSEGATLKVEVSTYEVDNVENVMK